MDLHSRIPYLNERDGAGKREKDNPQKILYDRVEKEHRKQMSSIYKWN